MADGTAGMRERWVARSQDSTGGSTGGSTGAGTPAAPNYTSIFSGLLSNPSESGIMGLLSSIPQFQGLFGGLGQTPAPAPQPGGMGSIFAPPTGSTFGQMENWINGLSNSAPPLSTASPAFRSAYPTISKDLYSTAKKK